MSKEKETKKVTSTKSNAKKNTSKVDTKPKKTSSKNAKSSKNEKEKNSKVSQVKEEKVLTSPIIEEEEYDEDLEDMEEEYEEETKKNTSKAKKLEKEKEKEELRNKVEKIEKIAKEKKKKVRTSNKNSKFNKVIELFEKYHISIYCFIGGVLLTTLIVLMIWPDRIATLKNGTQPVVKVGGTTYTANDLYDNMKSYYSVSLLLDQIDNDLLTKLYPEDDDMTSEVNSNAEYYLSTYKQYYGYTQEEFLEKNGFSSYDAFLDYLRLDYRRNKYMEDYIEENLTDEEIQKYYDDNVFGDINVQHILVETKSDSDDDDSDKLSDDDAKALAEEIITKLNDGTSWEQVQKDYKDKITYEDLSYQSWDASLEESFMTALKKMDENSYSDEPVKTSYGYHIIYRLDQKKKPSLKKSKKKIIENLVSDKQEEDSNILYKSLIALRKEKNIKFSDTDMKAKYDSYCADYK